MKLDRILDAITGDAIVTILTNLFSASVAIVSIIVAYLSTRRTIQAQRDMQKIEIIRRERTSAYSRLLSTASESVMRGKASADFVQSAVLAEMVAPLGLKQEIAAFRRHVVDSAPNNQGEDGKLLALEIQALSDVLSRDLSDLWGSNPNKHQ